MKYKFAAVALVATALAVTPVAPAEAHGWGHHDGLLFGVAAAGGAIVGAAVALATAPVRILADAAAPPPAPVYAAPVYAAPAPYYAYPQPQAVVYSYPQGYGYPVYGRPHYYYR
jgi:hypothetical protein